MQDITHGEIWSTSQSDLLRSENKDMHFVIKAVHINYQS